MPIPLPAALLLVNAWMVPAVLVSSPATSVILPEGTRLEVRLTTPVSSRKNHAGDPVAAVLLHPLIVDTQTVVPAGTELRGVVIESGHGRITRRGCRARLLIEFRELRDDAGGTTPVAARVADVDNARETVDDEGRIVGAASGHLRPRRLDAAFLAAAPFFPVTFLSLECGRFLEREMRRPRVHFESGTEMTLRLTQPAAVVPPVIASDELRQELASDPALAALVVGQPVFATKPSAGKPSDPINVVFLGDAASIDAAFRAAGWTRAAGKGVRTMAKGLFALAMRRGYRSAPLSALEVDGRRADMAYEKQCNTVAKRHHVRLWRRPEHFLGEEVWVAAATHDVSLAFSARRCTVIHRIEPAVDAEREKIVRDLLFAQRVGRYAEIDRPGVPTHGYNAYNDPFVTDGRVAVLFLGAPARFDIADR